MTPEQIQQLIEQNFTDSQATVNADGSHYQVLVVSPEFEGLRPVQKQQRIYALLNDAIAKGDIHAVTIKTYTPAEWEKARHFQVDAG